MKSRYDLGTVVFFWLPGSHETFARSSLGGLGFRGKLYINFHPSKSTACRIPKCLQKKYSLSPSVPTALRKEMNESYPGENLPSVLAIRVVLGLGFRVIVRLLLSLSGTGISW